MSAEAVATDEIVDAKQERAWKREEAAIARKYMGRVPWEMVAWGLGNFAFWLSLWPLTLTGVLPLWAAFVFSTLSITILLAKVGPLDVGVVLYRLGRPFPLR